jgi:hypothetical protein
VIVHLYSFPVWIRGPHFVRRLIGEQLRASLSRSAFSTFEGGEFLCQIIG